MTTTTVTTHWNIGNGDLGENLAHPSTHEIKIMTENKIISEMGAFCIR